jgi:hypothetical protein
LSSAPKLWRGGQVDRGAAGRFAWRLNRRGHRDRRAEEMFRERTDRKRLVTRLEAIIPTYGIDLKTDADACRRTRAETALVLKIENV